MKNGKYLKSEETLGFWSQQFENKECWIRNGKSSEAVIRICNLNLCYELEKHIFKKDGWRLNEKNNQLAPW